MSLTSHSSSSEEDVPANFRNIYGEPLKPCRQQGNDPRGSWDQNGKCTEMGGGVHQICINFNQQNKNFASETSQPMNWSAQRLGKSHCVCLGAYALFKAKNNKIQEDLNCDAISDTVFQPYYIQKWSTWNGYEKPGQILKGLDSVYKTCLQRAGTAVQRSYLDSRYHSLMERLSVLNIA